MSKTLLRKLSAMDAAEARFRASSLWHQWAGRARVLAYPRWERSALEQILARDGRGAASLSDLRTAAHAGDWRAAHRILVRRFASGTSAFPVNARDLPAVSDRIRHAVHGAAHDAASRGAAIIEGRYDVLGYEGLQWGRPPDWHLDPVHGRRAPLLYWADVPYLDPAIGDHKVIWEINRHQHWIALGRAFRLTGDEQFRTEFVTQLESWLAANPPLTGVNWASMLELAFRSLSWLWALQMFCTDDAAGSESPWAVDLLIALDRQLTHVEHHLSRYFSPNTHLTGEALALYVAGQALPELASSRRRAAIGREILVEEARRQIAEDGGHRELSGHYHRYSTDFYLLALAVARRTDDDAAHVFETAARRQAHYLRTICDAHGRRPSIGDDDGGQLFPVCGRAADDCRDSLAVAARLLYDPSLAIEEAPEEVSWWGLDVISARASKGQGDREGPRRRRTDYIGGSCVLSGTGYCVSRAEDGSHLIFDAGRHGYLNGGHAHSDALAIVLTLGDTPLLVDPGTATYTMSERTRDRFRSTAMHNTVVVGGAPQSQPRGPFHWQTSADACARVVSVGDGCDYFEATHDGYAPIVHTRGVLAVTGVGWFVIDTLTGPGSTTAELYWHLGPSWTPRRADGSTIALAASGRTAAIGCSADLEIIGPRDAEGLSDVSPAYGRVVPSHTLRARVGGNLPICVLTAIVAAPATQDRDDACGVARIDVPPIDDNWQADGFHLDLPKGRATLVRALERSGIAPSSSGGPQTLWGLPELRTDARVALLIEDAARGAEITLVNGRRGASLGRPALILPERCAIARAPMVARAVHQLAHQD